MLDATNPKHAHVEERLRSEPIMWLSSVRPDGRPHLVPVWFLWDGATILIFSQPSNQKIRNLRHNPQVTLALEAANAGNDIAIIEGTAELLEDGAMDTTLPAYVTKYGEAMKHLGMDAAQMAAVYSQGIRVTPGRLIAW